MTPRHALEVAMDGIRARRNAELARRGGEPGSASLGSNALIRARVGAFTESLGVLHLMLAKLPADLTITQNQISEARSRAISPGNTPRREAR